MEPSQDNSIRKSDKRRAALLVGGIAAAGLLYFGWQYYQKKKAESGDDQSDDTDFSDKKISAPQKDAFTPDYYKKSRNDNFPLTKGSKGARVKTLQDSLITKYGKGILPKYGADGDFGTELNTALKKVNLPSTIDESTFNVITQATASIDAASLAQALYKDAVNRNLTGVLTSLRKMGSKDDYTAVSNSFKQYLLRGVRQTLVNGILGSFPDETQKQQIRLEFSRMGLKYDGIKWSLSGITGFRVMTTKPALVWRTPAEGAKVPANMMLGTEIATRDGYTLFENEGKKFIVKTSSVKYV